jgi:hypothetical protein
MTAYTKSGIVLRAENRSQGAVFVMAATDPSAVFFCAHGSHDECIATPVNGHAIPPGYEIRLHEEREQLSDDEGLAVGPGVGSEDMSGLGHERFPHHKPGQAGLRALEIGRGSSPSLCRPGIMKASTIFVDGREVDIPGAMSSEPARINLVAPVHRRFES